MAQRRAYHASSDPRYVNLGRYLAAVASVEAAVKNDRSLTPSYLRVGLYIVEVWRGAESLQLRYCHPPGEKIAAHLELSERTVDYAIAALKRAGYFRVHPGSKRREQANRYFPIAQRAPAAAKVKTPAVVKADSTDAYDDAEMTPEEIAEEAAEEARRAEEEADIAAYDARELEQCRQLCDAAGVPCDTLPGWQVFSGYFASKIAELPAPVTRAVVFREWRAHVSFRGVFGATPERKAAAPGILEAIDLAVLL